MAATEGTDESLKIAYVFPGQGSQFVGMGSELYKSSEAARGVFDQVDEILGAHLTEIIFEGPQEELEKTVNSQPAIMATSLACLRAMEEMHGQVQYVPAAVAGHSLGEYTSLVVSGAVDLEDGFRLVRERGRLMQEACDQRPGSMAAILGLDETTLAEVCMETGAQIANINGGGQIVISGDKLCVARALDMASIRGAKRAIPLPVSGAFHSTLMSPAQEGLSAAIDEITIRDPDIPIIANATSDPLTTAEMVRAELRTQLCSCVRWKQSVGRMIDEGVSGFIEFGPGRVLGGLIKRISSDSIYKDRSLDIMNVADLETARQVATASALA